MEIKDRFIWAGDNHPPVRKMASVAADHIEVHHSVTAMPYTSHADGTIRGIYKFHIGERGYADIFYNYLIDRQGVIWEGRNAKHRASVGTALTVCCLANYAIDEVPPAVKKAILELNEASGYTKPLSWHAKRAFGTKYASACPGRSMVEWLEAGYPMPSGQGNIIKMNKEQATSAVQWCYTNILGREADPGGLAYWVDRLVNGLAVDDMRWQFVAVRFAMDQGPQAVGGRDKFVSDLIALAKASD